MYVSGTAHLTVNRPSLKMTFHFSFFFFLYLISLRYTVISGTPEKILEHFLETMRLDIHHNEQGHYWEINSNCEACVNPDWLKRCCPFLLKVFSWNDCNSLYHSQSLYLLCLDFFLFTDSLLYVVFLSLIDPAVDDFVLMHCVFIPNSQLCPLLMAQYPFCLCPYLRLWL